MAGDKTKSAAVDCSINSLAAEIDKLDTSIANIIEFTGDCVEDIAVSGHRNLTLRGVGGASITATQFDPASQPDSTTALKISRSDVTVDSVTINGGYLAIDCTDRSVCILRDVDMLRGHEALSVQSQSAADVYGSSIISGGADGFAGIGVYGASAVNIRPHWPNGYDPDEAGYKISGFFYGVVVQDGSFFRSDNLEVTENFRGILARRGAMAKILSGPDLPGVHNNTNTGVDIKENSTAQVITPIAGNGSTGLAIGPLSSVQAAEQLIEDPIDCYDDTARSRACPAL